MTVIHNFHRGPSVDIFDNLFSYQSTLDSIQSEIKPFYFKFKKREKGYEFRVNRTAFRWIPEKKILYTYKWVPERSDSIEYLRQLFQKYEPIEIPEEECDSF